MRIKWVIVACGILSSLLVNASPESAQELMSTWINLESQKGHMQESWLERKVSMEQKIDLFEIEKESIEALLADTSNENSEADKERKKLLQKQTRLEQEQAEMESLVNTAVNQLQLMVNKLPPPIAREWNQKLPSLSTQDLTTSEKLESILNLLKLSDEFDERVALNKEAISIEVNGESKKIVVNQIYLGLGHAWFVSDDGTHFGYGKATESGWTWWSEQKAVNFLGNELNAKQVLSALDVLKNPTNARYLSLPLVLNK